VNAYPLFVEPIPEQRRGVLAALFVLSMALGGLVGDPLNDPNRHTRVQAFGWRADGFPDFGTPVADGPYSP